MPLFHEEKLDALKAHPRGAQHLALAIEKAWAASMSDGVKSLPDGDPVAAGRTRACLEITDAAFASASADLLLPGRSPRPAPTRDGEPDKLAGMLDTILAEVTAAQQHLADAGEDYHSYLQSKLTNASKLAALARSVRLEQQRPAALPTPGLRSASAAGILRGARMRLEEIRSVVASLAGPNAARVRELSSALSSDLRLALERAEQAETPTPMPPGIVQGLTLEALRAANATRQVEWCSNGQVPDLAYRGIELAGEVGEALNILKKLERERLGWAGSRTTLAALAAELADVVIAADLVAMKAGIDLATAVPEKFNATSAERGLATVLQNLQPDTGIVAEMGTGAAAIVLERRRQVEVEGWTAKHDRSHQPSELASAGMAYLLVACRQLRAEDHATLLPDVWPWGRSWWKPSTDPGRNLEKGGALVAAAIDRLLMTVGAEESTSAPAPLPTLTVPGHLISAAATP